jgi:hypothetical protein
MGAGRIEVSRTGGNSRRYVFLHVLDIADSEDPPGRVKAFEDGQWIRVAAGDRTLVFKADTTGLER